MTALQVSASSRTRVIDSTVSLPFHGSLPKKEFPLVHAGTMLDYISLTVLVLDWNTSHQGSEAWFKALGP